MALEQFIFTLINQDLTHEWADIVMPFLREKRNWIPLYIFLILLISIKFPKRNALFILLFVGLSIGLSDTLSSKILKPLIERPRPCHAVSEVVDTVRLLVPCGGGFSFPSSHATNHFALAVLLSCILTPMFRYAKYFFLLWAGSIAYAQVYVGLHYPLDILGGAVLGSFVGYVMYLLLQKVLSFVKT